MKYTILYLFILTCILYLPEDAKAHSCDYPIYYSSDPDGNAIKLVLPYEVMKNAPRWSPEMGEPVLSVASAYAVALNWSKKISRDVMLTQVDIRAHGCPQLKGYWYYLFLFRPIDRRGNIGYGDAYHVVVLMDGSVVDLVVGK